MEGFVENGFIVDLSNSKDTAGIIFELSSILDLPEAKGKNICLKLGKIDLSRSQLLSIKALIEAMDSELANIDTNSEQTETSAQNLGLVVSKIENEIEVEFEEEIQAEDSELEEEISEEDENLPTEEESPKIAKGGYETRLIDSAGDAESEEKSEEILGAESKLETLFDNKNEKDLKKADLELELSKLPTLYVQQNLRSGQTISYDGNILIIGDVHPGSEVIAKGDITIWGILGGIAHAGARGNDYARIRALKMNAIQLRISGYYARRPDTVNIPFIQRTTEFTPEEARVNEGEIAIYRVIE